MDMSAFSWFTSVRMFPLLFPERKKREEPKPDDKGESQEDRTEGGITPDIDRPPPLPPRRPSKVFTSPRCSQESHVHEAPSPSPEDDVGRNWHRQCNGMAGYNAKYSSSENDIMFARSRATKKRYNFNKTHDPCIVLSRSSSTTSSGCSVEEEESPTPGRDLTPSPDINMNHSVIGAFEQNGNYMKKSKRSEGKHHKSAYRRQRSNEEVGRGLLGVPALLRHSQSDASLQSLRSCPEIGPRSCGHCDVNCDVHSSLCGRDFYGSVNRNSQKSPPRKKSDHPSRTSYSFDVNEADSVIRRERAHKRMPQRPHSIGYFDNHKYAKLTNIRRQHAVSSRNSDPYLMTSQSSPTSPCQKRMPLVLQDDPGSVSDLEYIMESPHELR